MAESGHETEDRAVPTVDVNQEAAETGSVEFVAENVVPETGKPVDEAKIAELLLEFERENEANENGYPYWRRGVVWSIAAAVICALVLYMLYFGSGIVWRPVLGTVILTLAVWVGSTFLPVKA